MLQDFLKAKDSLHPDTIMYHTRCVCEVFYNFKCCLWGVLLERRCSFVSYQIKMFKNQTFFKVKYLQVLHCFQFSWNIVQGLPLIIEAKKTAILITVVNLQCLCFLITLATILLCIPFYSLGSVNTLIVFNTLSHILKCMCVISISLNKLPLAVKKKLIFNIEINP
jgi:hypothetical protein